MQAGHVAFVEDTTYRTSTVHTLVFLNILLCRPALSSKAVKPKTTSTNVLAKEAIKLQRLEHYLLLSLLAISANTSRAVSRAEMKRVILFIVVCF